jgi:hypothetical protein
MTPVSNHSSVPPEAAATQHVFQLATGYMITAALSVALELRLADHIAGPRTTADLAQVLGVQEDPLYRVLRALASAGMFNETSPRTFEPNLVSKMVRSDVPGTAYALLRFICDPHHFRVYSELMNSVKTGKPAAEAVFGAPIFEVFARDKEWAESFDEAMTSFSAQIIPAALDAYDFGELGVLVDIAGGRGEVLIQTLRRYPRARGVLFDVERVVEPARARFAAAGLHDRVDIVAGDFFTDVPPGGDVYLMKHIIHDWDDDRAGVILRNIHRAVANRRGGKVVLIESVLQSGNDPDLGKVVDLEMLAMAGGRERTGEEFAALFAANGFELTKIVPTQSPASVIEARVREVRGVR